MICFNQRLHSKCWLWSTGWSFFLSSVKLWFFLRYELMHIMHTHSIFIHLYVVSWYFLILEFKSRFRRCCFFFSFTSFLFLESNKKILLKTSFWAQKNNNSHRKKECNNEHMLIFMCNFHLRFFLNYKLDENFFNLLNFLTF